MLSIVYTVHATKGLSAFAEAQRASDNAPMATSLPTPAIPNPPPTTIPSPVQLETHPDIRSVREAFLHRVVAERHPSTTEVPSARDVVRDETVLAVIAVNSNSATHGQPQSTRDIRSQRGPENGASGPTGDDDALLAIAIAESLRPQTEDQEMARAMAASLGLASTENVTQTMATSIASIDTDEQEMARALEASLASGPTKDEAVARAMAESLANDPEEIERQRTVTEFLAAVKASNLQAILDLVDKNRAPQTTGEIQPNKEIVNAASKKRQTTALMKAIKRHDHRIVSLLIKMGANLNSLNRFGLTALHYAIYFGNVEAAKLLLSSSALEIDPQSMVKFARERKQFGIIDLIIDYDRHRLEERQISATHELFSCFEQMENLQSINGKQNISETSILEAIKKALSEGGDINVKNEKGQVLLMKAAACGHLRIIELLLRHKANINDVDQNKSTALHWAVAKGQIEVARMLCKHAGIDLSLENANKKTALELAKTFQKRAEDDVAQSRDVVLNQKKTEDYKLIIQILENSISSNQTQNFDYQDLVMAFTANNLDAFLRGRNINAQGADGQTALMHAASNGHSALLVALLEEGAEVDIQDAHGNTALHLAVGSGSVESVIALLRKNPDVTLQADLNGSRFTAGELANHIFGMKPTVENGAISQLITNYALRELMTANGLATPETPSTCMTSSLPPANISELTEEEQVQQALALSLGETAMPERSLSESAQQPLQDTSSQSPKRENVHTPGFLEILGSGDDDLLLSYLSENGINTTTSQGRTALMFFALKGEMDRVNLLLENGADVNRQDESGKTALHFAISGRSVACTGRLLDENADLSLCAVAPEGLVNPIQLASILSESNPDEERFQQINRLIAMYKERSKRALQIGNTPEISPLLHAVLSRSLRIQGGPINPVCSVSTSSFSTHLVHENDNNPGSSKTAPLRELEHRNPTTAECSPSLTPCAPEEEEMSEEQMVQLALELSLQGLSGI